MEQYTFIGFLITCVFGLSLFAKYLVSKIIKLTADCHEAMIDVKNAVRDNSEAVKANSQAVQQLREAILTINK